VATPRFVLDVHLGKLAAYLRLLSFDTLYRADPDAELARISADEQRVLLTCDRHLLKRSIVAYGYVVRATDPRQRVAEIVCRFELATTVAPYQRCSRCNGLLHPVDKTLIAHRLLPKTRQVYEEFQIGHNCQPIYWHGSHVERLQPFIDQVAQIDSAQ